MNRRSWFQCLAAIFAPTKPPAAPCITPACAGFDGSLSMFSGNRIARVILTRCLASNPKRWNLPNNQIGVWKNEDGSVVKMIYRNRDGRLFDLQFVPMDEPS